MKTYYEAMVQIQQDILKEKVKKDMNKRNDLMSYSYTVTENSIDILQGRWCIKIPKCCMYVDLEKVLDKVSCSFDMERYNTCEAKQVSLTQDIYRIPDTTTQCIRFTCNDFDVYVDERLLKMFGDSSQYTFKAVSKTSPVMLFIDNDMIGCICPVNVNR